MRQDLHCRRKGLSQNFIPNGVWGMRVEGMNFRTRSMGAEASRVPGALIMC